MSKNSWTIRTINEGLVDLRKEIRKLEGTAKNSQHMSICGMLVTNMVLLEEIKKNGNKDEKREAEVVLNYIKYLKGVIDALQIKD